MKRLGFYLVLPIIYLISYLPFGILYLFSDFLYLIVYYLIGYRKKVVKINLKRSFPEKSEAERLKIEKEFYHYIIDFFLETLKCVTISQETLKQRWSIQNDAILDELLAEKRNIIVTAGHFGNHEMGNLALSFLIKYQVKAVYRPLNNKYFDKFFYDFRTKFGSILISMANASKEIGKKEDFNYAFFLVNDQSPPPERSYWTTFLNQETGFFTGIERFARQYDMPVVYMCIDRYARGKYRVNVELITKEPNTLPEGELLEIHARKLERDIKANPSIWFWSHKRWKYTKVNGEIVPVSYK
ncbi:lipid A biosynthesis acyltransferase [Emticicia oligotrophica DSM 17448]|uniref:Lipid A biosynthesis acyltransferase n=1 Tax=Emticicia oligotrophica (strain DSM 17448 / CIP 109782 / MTCC 6937 / GPTSA100-15) TaxID=929562 RepID=A0ABM5N6P6_EMTOG|nr:lipid A biosynthesis acyltransferase [Emticicia oligotrophica]AFK05221.1 lipid A biosynthesis acyltransferase [Emticicia oligotrophica DSM 17448]